MKRLFVLIFMGAVFLSACSTGRWIKTPVLEEKNLTVSLEHRMEKDRIIPQKYHHPYKINPLTLHKLLTDLVYTEKSGFWQNQTENPVFQKIEVDRIAPALTDALANATPDQRIRFTSLNRGGGGLLFELFKNRRKTNGVIFIDPASNLNIAFACINVEIDPNNNTTELPDSLTRVDPLKLKSADTVLLPIPPYAIHHTDKNGIPIPMWIEADLEKLQEIIKAEHQSPDQTDQTDQTRIPHSSIKATTDFGKPFVKPPVKQPATDTDDPLERIKNKLIYLKELFEAGLINKQEYEAKKKEFLTGVK